MCARLNRFVVREQWREGKIIMSLKADAAVALVQTALRLGAERKMPVAVVVLDAGGRTLAAARSEQAGFINLAVAERKALASVNFKAPTHAVLDMIKSDQLLLNVVGSDAAISILPGGFPIAAGGTVVGALGIAGGHYSQDQALGEEVLTQAAPKG
jgi:glc operon protein GlcG